MRYHYTHTRSAQILKDWLSSFSNDREQLELSKTFLLGMQNGTTTLSVALQIPLSMGFPRQEYQSGLPFPSLGDLPDPGIKPVSHALTGRFFITEPPGKHTLELVL